MTQYFLWPSGLNRKRMTAVAASAAIVVGLVLAVINRPPPPISDQIDKIRSGFTAKGFQVSTWSAQLHPDGGESTVLVAKPTDKKRNSDSRAHERLVIYDQDESRRLKPAFTFEPVAETLSNAGPLPASARPERFTFPLDPDHRDAGPDFDRRDILQFVDVDGADGNEVLGAVTELGIEQDVFPRPFVIAWDVVNHRYALQALLSPKSTSMNTMAGQVQKPVGKALDYAPLLYQNTYLHPTLIRNEGTPQVLEAFAPDTYVLKKLTPDRSSEGNAGRLQLRAAYAVAGTAAGTMSEIQVIDWTLIMRPNGGDVTAYPQSRPNVAVGVNSSQLESVLEALQ